MKKEKDFRLPELMIIGAPKAGTTSLAGYLDQLPTVSVAQGKETHFFDDDEIYNEGVLAFSKYFFSKAMNSAQVWVDATPSYLANPDVVIPRIREIYNGAGPKFVVMLRDPKKRAWSHYLHQVRVCRETRSFIQACEEQEQNKRSERLWTDYIGESLYSQYLRVWIDTFGIENFVFMKQETLSTDPESVIRAICRHVGIQETNLNLIDVRLNTSGEAPRSRFLMRMLNCQVPFPHLTRRFISRVWRRRIRIALRKLNLKEQKTFFPNAPDVETNRYIQEKLDDEVYEIEKVTGVSFQEWRKIHGVSNSR
jgi:hypothetical protein